jgi:hypothetical protein
MSNTRVRDTKRELRIKLECSCKLSDGIKFYHEKTKKKQILAATLSADGERLHVVLFTDRLDTIKK